VLTADPVLGVNRW